VHAQPRTERTKHARVGLRSEAAKHPHVLDRDDRVEQVLDAQRAQHPQRISAWCVGEDQLASGEALDRREIVPMAADARFEAGQTVRVVQEVRGLHTVVAHQSEQGGTVALPVAPAQRLRLLGRQAQFTLHVLAHGHVDPGHRRSRRVVQRVVKVKQPDPLQCERIIVP
jgi:hypothetical protein